VTFTSAHRDSVLALANGQADIASIDAWSLALIADEQPELTAGLHRVALGPRIPTPAITARRSLELDQLDELRRAFGEGLAEPATAPARKALRIAGFADTRLTITARDIEPADGLVFRNTRTGNYITAWGKRG
jgi:ABC-type phosphate/phosphonate transport system substrate-binding protein